MFQPLEMLGRELTSAAMSTNDYSYAYDSIGNRVDAMSPSRSLSYVANELNQYTQTTDNSSTNNYTYDADGNLLSDGTSTYTWNGENRLIQASNAVSVVTFKYDHQGRRFEKTVNATNTTRFVYDGWNLIAEVAGSATNSYVWGLDLAQSLQGAGGVGGLLSVVSKAQSLEPKAFFPCFDANGNVTDYVSTNGTVAAHFEYDAFGNTTSESIAQGLMPNAFSCRFSTKYFDSETGLYYYGYRYYSPELGRWINRDPIGERGGVNVYEFVFNNTVNRRDYLGFFDGEDAGSALGFFIASPEIGLAVGVIGEMKDGGGVPSYSDYDDDDTGWAGDDPSENDPSGQTCSSGATTTGLKNCTNWEEDSASFGESSVRHADGGGSTDRLTVKRTKTCTKLKCDCRCSTGQNSGFYFDCKPDGKQDFIQTKDITRRYK